MANLTVDETKLRDIIKEVVKDEVRPIVKDEIKQEITASEKRMAKVMDAKLDARISASEERMAKMMDAKLDTRISASEKTMNTVIGQAIWDSETRMTAKIEAVRTDLTEGFRIGFEGLDKSIEQLRDDFKWHEGQCRRDHAALSGEIRVIRRHAGLATD